MTIKYFDEQKNFGWTIRVYFTVGTASRRNHFGSDIEHGISVSLFPAFKKQQQNILNSWISKLELLLHLKIISESFTSHIHILFGQEERLNTF